MTLEQIKKELLLPKYNFLQQDDHLNGNIVLLTIGGSYAYGTNINTKDYNSDLDIRGIALNHKDEILLGKDFEQINNKNTDTVIYSFNKVIKLLSNCNPNIIELLGCKKEHYLYISSIGQELINNSKLFLSKKAAYAFGSYASSQLRLMRNKSVRTKQQSERENHILNSINNAYATFPEKYFEFPDDSIKLYIDKAVQEGYDTEIFMDINLHHYPLRDYKGMLSEMSNIVKDYNKIGKRNKHAIEKGKLGKHMTHLIRLYMMCLDILEKEKIITYRETEHDLLMDIRNGKFLDDNRQPISEFYEMVDEYEKKLDYAKQNTSLPEKPDYKKINEFVASVNERIVNGEV